MITSRNRASLAAAVLTVSLPWQAAAKPKTDPALLVTVNGVAVKRQQVMDRVWSQHATGALNDIVDEILISQAADSLKIQLNEEEINARMKRIGGQFQDEATFKERLSAMGSSIEGLRTQIERQVLREQVVVTARGLAVSDGEAQKFFEVNEGKLGTPATVRLRHILLAQEKEANDFLLALRAGADFERLAAGVSIDEATKDKGGDLGFLSPESLQPDIGRVVAGLTAGQVSAVVRSPQGYHIFKVEELRPSKPAVFDSVQKELKQALLADKITKVWPDYLQELHAKAKIVPAAAASR